MAVKYKIVMNFWMSEFSKCGKCTNMKFPEMQNFQNYGYLEFLEIQKSGNSRILHIWNSRFPFFWKIMNSSNVEFRNLQIFYILQSYLFFLIYGQFCILADICFFSFISVTYRQTDSCMSACIHMYVYMYAVATKYL